MNQPIEETITVDYLKSHPQYLSPVAEWMFAEWGGGLAASTLAQARERVMNRMNDKEIPLTLIALLDGELVGTAALKHNDMDTRPDLRPWLAGVYVKQGMRDKGIGSLLVTAVEKEASKLGVEKLYLFTPSRRSFYERLGWSAFEETEYRGEHVTLMTKTLA